MKLIGYFRLGNQRLDRGLSTLFIPDAIAHLHKLIDQELDEGGTGKGMPLEELASGYLQDLERMVAEGARDWKTLRAYKPRVRRFLDFCANEGVGYVGELTPELLLRYQSFLRDQGFKSRTIAQEQVTTIKALLRRAWQERLTAEDLTASLPPVERTPKLKPRVYTRDEIGGILRVMRRRPHLRRRTTFLRFALYTGCRKEQARVLRWTDVDLEARTGHAHRPETHRPALDTAHATPGADARQDQAGG